MNILEIIGYILLFFLTLRLLVSVINYLAKMGDRPQIPAEFGVCPRWSLLVPARDEVKNIGVLLSGVAEFESDCGLVEVIVYDDGSTDGTANVVKSYMGQIPGLRLIEGGKEALPKGWLGKTHACHRLGVEAKGEYLLFVDADVQLGKEVAGKYILYAHNARLALLSLFPKQLLSGFQAKITTPLMNWILLSLLPLPLVRHSGWSSFSAANGQFMLFSAHEYKKMLPHKKYGMSRAEDIEICRYYKNARLKVATLTADKTVLCTMYKSANEAINGFSKNIFFFFGNSVIVTILFAVITTITPFWLFIFNSTAAGLVSIAAILTVRILISKASYMNTAENVLLLPVQHYMFLKIVVRAVKNRYKKELIWKGRNIYLL